jgi:hypothetical protein
MSGEQSFHHFVLTRFDVNLGDQSRYRTDEWFERRLDLFEQFTCPSIASQTNQNFTWIVFFHEKSRATVESRFGTDPELYTPVFTAALWEPAVVRAAVRSLGAPENGTVVSTQLDCDDVLAPDTIERIQHAVERDPSRRAYLNFPLGYQFAQGRFYIALDPSNPFITLVEPVTNLDQALFAYHLCHEDASDHAPVVQVDWTPAWLQIVHGTNISNHTNGLRIRNTKPWEEFRHLPGIGRRRPESRLEVEKERLANAGRLARKAFFRPLGRRRLYRALKVDGAMTKIRGRAGGGTSAIGSRLQSKPPNRDAARTGEHAAGHDPMSETGSTPAVP